MTFEAEHVNGAPFGWGGGPPEAITVDNDRPHRGRWSARINLTTAASQPFATITRSMPVNFSGKSIELRGFIRTQDVTGFAGLWLRQDGDTQGLHFDNMQSRQLKGTTDWTEYAVTLPLHPEAKMVVFGFLVSGAGKGWVDDLQLLVDGKPVWEAPPVRRLLTVLDTDHEFDGGSRSSWPTLTQTQIGHLHLLGKMWGFLKYHHPQVTSGKSHWDYALLRVLPAVLAAPDTPALRTILEQWVAQIGDVAPCDPCARLDDTKLHLRPRLEWIADTDLLGESLSKQLQTIYRNRSTATKQFYVSHSPHVGNPNFEHELGYERLKFPDHGFQLLALYRMWNIVEYWFPYRDVLEEDWDEVLREFIPRISLAQSRDAYQLELMAFIARIHDTHANLWSSMAIRPPVGPCLAPVYVRFIGKQPVVTGYSNADAGAATTLLPGDVVESLDGVAVSTLVDRWTPYYAASNDAARFRDIAMMMSRGECVDTSWRVRRGTETLDMKFRRLPISSVKVGEPHDSPGETFRKLSDEVAYLKLSSVKAANASKYVTEAAGSKGLVIDIRNYPSEFMVFALGSLLVDKPTPFVSFTIGDASNPGAFSWGPAVQLMPQQPHYRGKVVILIDEASQSQSEYTAMAFRSSPRATVVGSTTAGADGNISPIPLPGGLRSMISGIGVFYPDKRPTQRVGIVPDIEVRPTIEGIRAGRDEVLERALRLILGPDVSDAEIEEKARRK